jgi:hypothetical protein
VFDARGGEASWCLAGDRVYLVAALAFGERGRTADTFVSV